MPDSPGANLTSAGRLVTPRADSLWAGEPGSLAWRDVPLESQAHRRPCDGRVRPAPDVRLRRLPLTSKAAIAICSDLDLTPDIDAYWRISQFLCTADDTEMGPGLGLDVGNSIYFDMPPGQLSWWNADAAGRDLLAAMIRSGHIDCLHSFGDLAADRRAVQRSLDDLVRRNCRLEVWVDHARAPTNFGADIMCGRGDVKGDNAYHADLTLGLGIQYVWRGRVTSVCGQQVPWRLGGLFSPRHPLRSAVTSAKETAKHALGWLGSRKYAPHRLNRLLWPATLRDGQHCYEFLRCNPHWGGVSSGETGRQIGEVLTPTMIARLLARGGMSVLYTHLGKVDDPRRPFCPQAVAALRRLAEAHYSGRLLVTTTRRLLGFGRAMIECRPVFMARDDSIVIDVGAPDDLPDRDLAGLAFVVPRHCKVTLVRGSRPLAAVLRDAPGRTGCAVATIPWPRMELPRP